MEIFLNLLVFVFGCCIGSFSNVCIYRWHVGTSVIKERSHCDTCGAKINWYDNIPILSYILLRGKCRNCHTQLSLQYPFVELLTGLVFLAIYYTLGNTILTAKLMFVSWLFIVATVSDILYYEVPDELTVISVPVMIFLALIGETSWFDLALGVFAPGLFLWLFIIISDFFTDKIILGGGDAKFMFCIGGIMGAGFSMSVLLIGCLAIALIYFSFFIEDIVSHKQTYVPMLVGFATAYFLILMSEYLTTPKVDVLNALLSILSFA